MVDLKKMIENKKALVLLILTLFLASCGNSGSSNIDTTASNSSKTTQVEQQNLGDNSEDISESNNSQVIENSTSKSDVSVASAEGKLTISSKCIGCGHCVRFSSTNFSMNTSTHKAEVISQENIDSIGVTQAIERCPASAISIS